MTDRVDELDQYYAPIETCDKWVGGLFWACVLFSVGVLYSDAIPISWVQRTLSVLFMVTVVAHFALSLYSSFYLIPTAEDIRRRQLLSNAFNVPLTPEKTQAYYNNQLAPSVTRLGACVLEDALFGKSVCHEMAKTERLKVFVYFILWIAAISYRNTDPDLVLILTQVLFSSDILIRLIKIEVLRSRNKAIYDALYSHFLNRASPADHSGIATILDSFASYESAKAAACIKQSSEIFHRLNPELSTRWDDIRSQLRIDNWDSNNATDGDGE